MKRPEAGKIDELVKQHDLTEHSIGETLIDFQDNAFYLGFDIAANQHNDMVVQLAKLVEEFAGSEFATRLRNIIEEYK